MSTKNDIVDHVQDEQDPYKGVITKNVAEQLQGRLRGRVLSQQKGSCKQDAARKPGYIQSMWEG